MNDTDNVLNKENFKDQLAPEETSLAQADPLQLNIKDSDLVKISDDRVKAYKKFYEQEYNLDDRRYKNELYYFGKQIIELDKNGKLKNYESKNLDNILYEIVATQTALSMSQMPDLLVTPGRNTDDSRDTADLLTTVVNSDVKKRSNRKVLSLASKHRKVYFLGVIKAVWNPELAGGMGDYQFIVVHPNNIEFDHNATEADADKMEFVSHIAKFSVKKVFKMFPKAKEKLMDQLERDGILSRDQEPSYKAMATPLEIREFWFDDYEDAGDGKVRKVSGLIWKYKKVILGKMKNPDFDYAGEEVIYSYEDQNIKSSRRIVTAPEMQQSLITGQFPPNITKEKVYHNYFESPRKPFFFMSYDQWGKQPMDETTDLEQNLRNQEALDSINKGIQEKLKNRGHHVWSKETGLSPSDIEKMDHNNPDEDYLVDGKLNDVHEFINGEQVSASEFNEMDRIQNRMFQLAGANAVRGELKANQPATSAQIAREANYTRADDEVENTINAAAEWMASWALQFIKLRYTQDHFRKILGSKGEVVFQRLHQNMVEEGMEVMIKASGTDKIKAQNNAMEMAKAQLIDPLQFFRDMGLDDPEGRTVQLMMFMKAPDMYLQMFIKDNPNVTQELLTKLQQTPVAPPVAPPGMPPPGVTPSQGPLMGPQNPTPANTAAMPVAPPIVPQGSVSGLV